MRAYRTLAGVLAAVALSLVSLTACGTDESALRQVPKYKTVYIDSWHNDGDKGDQANVEQKPDGSWVIPMNAYFRSTPQKGFDLAVTRIDVGNPPTSVFSLGRMVKDSTGKWVFQPWVPSGLKVGKDHDACLAEGEVYAQVPPGLQFEPEDPEADSSNDDCERVVDE